MRSSPFNLRAALAAALVAGLSAMPSVAPPQHGVRQSNEPRRRRSGNRYPEQSSRQALRGMRRAQGGPGLVLVRGEYVPASQVL